MIVIAFERGMTVEDQTRAVKVIYFQLAAVPGMPPVAGGTVPSGGTTGQNLKKLSAADGDYGWSHEDDGYF